MGVPGGAKRAPGRAMGVLGGAKEGPGDAKEDPGGAKDSPGGAWRGQGPAGAPRPASGPSHRARLRPSPAPAKTPK
eukprot:gene8939-biopygen1846